MTRPVHPHSRARAWALQLLYAWEMAGEGPLLPFVRRELRRRRVSARYRPYLERLLRQMDARRPEIDRILRDTIPNWRLERLSAIDRAIVRIGALELEAMDVPPAVAIHEAVRLAERYGGDESPRFVNGVLDAVSRRVPAGG